MEEKIRLAVFGQKRLSREGGIEIVVKELCTRMAQNGCDITCYNRAGHHVSGAEYDKTIEYDGIRQKVVPTIEKKGLAAVSSSFFAALCSAFGRYDVVHIHAEGPAFFCWIPKLFGKRVCNLHYPRFGLGSREVARKRCIQVHSWRRKECCEICGRDHCSKQRRAEVFLGDLRKGDTFYP